MDYVKLIYGDMGIPDTVVKVYPIYYYKTFRGYYYMYNIEFSYRKRVSEATYNYWKERKKRG